jgi:hypothetical protein
MPSAAAPAIPVAAGSLDRDLLILFVNYIASVMIFVHPEPPNRAPVRALILFAHYRAQGAACLTCSCESLPLERLSKSWPVRPSIETDSALADSFGQVIGRFLSFSAKQE